MWFKKKPVVETVSDTPKLDPVVRSWLASPSKTEEQRHMKEVVGRIIALPENGWAHTIDVREEKGTAYIAPRTISDKSVSAVTPGGVKVTLETQYGHQGVAGHLFFKLQLDNEVIAHRHRRGNDESIPYEKMKMGEDYDALHKLYDYLRELAHREWERKNPALVKAAEAQIAQRTSQATEKDAQEKKRKEDLLKRL